MPGRLLKRILVIIALMTTQASLAEHTIRKPDLDLRQYRHISLENNLDVLLVHDEELTTAGAAMIVPVGGDNDPANLPGLAHLLEHMVFSGSENHPDRGGFNQYVNSAGGVYNAYTAADHTNYFFQVGADRLKEGLAHFSDFLVSPSLEPEAVSGEIDIIQSEFDGRQDQLGWRRLNVLRAHINPEHPASNMTMGNRKSLAHAPVKELVLQLKSHHQQFYTADQMKLVVMGPQPVAQLEKWATKYFERLKQSNHQAPDESGSIDLLPEKNELPRFIRMETIGDTDLLTITFPADPEHLYYETKPYTFLARILSSQQPGYLAPVLKEQGLIDGLNAGMELQGNDYATFGLQMTLTDKGSRSVNQIVASVFEYLDTIREFEDLNSLYQTYSRQAADAFRFPEKSAVVNEVARLAVSALRYPTEQVLTAPVLMNVYDKELINSALDKLSPESAIIIHAGEHTGLSERDPVTGTAYHSTVVSEPTIARWKAGKSAVDARISVPPNPFRDNKKKLHPLEENAGGLPLDLSETDGLTLWHLQDKVFRKPRGVITIAVESPLLKRDGRSEANMLYRMLLTEHLTELSQMGNDAGIQLGIGRLDHGLAFTIQGFTSKQTLFIKRLAQMIESLEVTTKLLDKAMAATQVQLDSLTNAQYFEQMMVSFNNQLRPWREIPQEELRKAQDFTAQDMMDYHKQFWSKPEVSLLAIGNYREADTRALSDVFIASLALETAPLKDRYRPVKRSEPVRRTVPEIPAGVAARYYPLADQKAKTMAVGMVTTQMLNQRIFEQFRESKQWGYVAFATILPGYEEWGSTLLLQAPGVEPAYLDKEIGRVIGNYRNSLADLSKKQFNQYRQGVKHALGARKQNLPSYSAYWWKTLRTQGTSGDRARKIEAVLEGLTLEEFRNASRQMLDPEAPMLTLLSSEPE